MSAAHPWPRVSPGNLAAGLRFSYMLALAAPFLGKRLMERHPGYIRRMIRGGAAKRDNFTKEDFRIYARDLRSPTRARAAVLLYRTFVLRELLPVLAGRYRRARLSTPTLILQGRRDPAVAPRLAFGAERHADDVRVELVPDAGHFLPEECPELVADRLLEFLAEAERPAGVEAGPAQAVPGNG